VDRLDIEVNGQVFGPQEVQNLLGFEYMFCRKHAQLSDAYPNTHFR
jgi:hypothetical protein